MTVNERVENFTFHHAPVTNKIFPFSAGSFEGYVVSTKSFLFRFEKTLGQPYKEVVLGLENVYKGVHWRKERGPIFGMEELGLSSDMRKATTSRLSMYGDKRTNGTSLLQVNSTYVHDIEVLAIGGESKSDS